jgi:hypothetical protein
MPVVSEYFLFLLALSKDCTAFGRIFIEQVFFIRFFCICKREWNGSIKHN